VENSSLREIHFHKPYCPEEGQLEKVGRMPARFARWWQVRKGLNEFGIQSKKEQCTVAALARNALRPADFRQITLVIPTPELTILWMMAQEARALPALGFKFRFEQTEPASRGIIHGRPRQQWWVLTKARAPDIKITEPKRRHASSLRLL
jgi:hypothetical protein